MFGFGHFLFPRSQKINFEKSGPKIERKCPYLPFSWGIVLFGEGLEPKNNLVGQENPKCPGRMNTSHKQETSIIYVTYVSTAYSSSAKEAGSHGRWFAPHQATIPPKAWPVWRGHANARARRRPAVSCGGQWAGCRCNIYDTAVCFVDYRSMLTRVLCELFFAADTSSQRKK